jgi:hypothetical protein
VLLSVEGPERWELLDAASWARRPLGAPLDARFVSASALGSGAS